MRQTKHSYLFFLILFTIGLASINPFDGNAQNSVKAFKHIEKYKEFVLFKNGITTTSIEEFQKLFSDTALVVFDIPLLDTARRNLEIKPISKDENTQKQVISLYSKKMPVETYTEMLQLLVKDKNILKSANIILEEPDHKENENDSLFYFKLKKSFPQSNYLLNSGEKNYLATVSVLDGKAVITDISENEFPNDFDLQFQILNINNGDPIAGISSDIEIKNVNNYGVITDSYSLSAISDSNGFIRFPRSTNAKSEIYFWTIKSSTETDYQLSGDLLGFKRGSDPTKVFEARLIPYQMRAVSTTLFVSGGMINQTPVSMTNFQSGSFNEEFSYKIGGGILVNWFWKTEKWTDFSRNNPALFGLSFGISYSVNHLSTNSSAFIQKRYDFKDVTGEDTKVEYSSSNFSEKNKVPQLGLPLLLDLNLKLGKNGASLLLGIGAKFNYNLKSTYESSGAFSRHGYYAINDYSKPITDATELNYYTNEDKSYEGDLTLNLWMTEAMLRISSLVPIIDGIGRKYSLEIGLEFTYPITKNNRYYKSNYGITSENAAETDYWINTGEDIYHSVMYGNERIYNYYLGLSVGFNLVGFVAKEKKLSQQGRN